MVFIYDIIIKFLMRFVTFLLTGIRETGEYAFVGIKKGGGEGRDTPGFCCKRRQLMFILIKFRNKHMVLLILNSKQLISVK